MAQTSHTIRHAQTDARDYMRVTPKLKQSGNLTYQIGSSQVLLGRNIVVSQNQQQTLRPMTFKTLRYLCENSGHVVDKERIIRYAWGNRCVTDDSLVQCIAEIRRALGDKNKKRLKTIPRVGYLLDAKKSEGFPSLSIGPLTSGDSNDQMLMAQGICDNISMRIMETGLISIHSMDHWNVTVTDYHLSGTLQFCSGRLRLGLRLIEQDTNRLLWVHQYENRLADDALTQQDVLSRQITDDLLTHIF